MSFRHIDLFSGIGGFSLAAQWVWGDEHEIACFCEPNKICQNVLRRHWPWVQIEENIIGMKRYDSISLISGGDPCPIRSKARSIWGTKHPDLSGYFLAVVGQCWPEWVLRENVPAPDATDFEAALELLGYRCVIITTNAYAYTGQNRIREVIVGCSKTAWMRQFIELYQRQSCEGINQQEQKNMATTAYPCLTTNQCRYDSRDGYIWDGSGKLRIADKDEREALAGFPLGWLDGLSETAVARVTGNAIVPQVVVPIMQAIKEIECGTRTP